MANRLKSIFSNKIYEFGCKLTFRDAKSQEEFYKALEIVYEEGRTVEVEGISTMSTNIRDGEMSYPYLIEKDISNFIVGPSIEVVPLKVNTRYGEKEVQFNRYQTNKEIILETGNKEIIFLKLAFLKEKNINGAYTVNFTYRFQLKYAKSVKAVAESFFVALEIVKHLFKPYDDKNISDGFDSLQNMIKSFQKTGLFFSKLSAIEDKLQLSFDPTKISNIDDEELDVEELFILLIEKKPIKLNAKLTSTESTGINLNSSTHKPEIGSDIEITFTGENTYSICGQDISIYTANLLVNAIIKDISIKENGEIKLLYDGTDSKPMYISYTGFETEEELEKEREIIMERREEYINALTTEEYIRKII